MNNKIEKLRAFLKQKGLTQEKIASDFGVSNAYINKLLLGKKEFGKQTAKKWSDLYGLSYTWLLTGEGDMVIGHSDDNNRDVPYAIYRELLDRYENVIRENEQLRARLAAYEPTEKRKLG